MCACGKYLSLKSMDAESIQAYREIQPTERFSLQRDSTRSTQLIVGQMTHSLASIDFNGNQTPSKHVDV